MLRVLRETLMFGVFTAAFLGAPHTGTVGAAGLALLGLVVAAATGSFSSLGAALLAFAVVSGFDHTRSWTRGARGGLLACWERPVGFSWVRSSTG